MTTSYSRLIRRTVLIAAEAGVIRDEHEPSLRYVGGPLNGEWADVTGARVEGGQVVRRIRWGRRAGGRSAVRAAGGGDDQRPVNRMVPDESMASLVESVE